MARITYGDKSTAQVSPLPEDQKWVSADANEVKESVNALYDIDGILVGVAGVVANIGEGTTGQVLTSAGPGAVPAWADSNKTFACTLYQEDTDAPFINQTIRQGPIVSIAWSYLGVGQYRGITDPVLPAGTLVYFQGSDPFFEKGIVAVENSGEVNINTYENTLSANDILPEVTGFLVINFP